MWLDTTRKRCAEITYNRADHFAGVPGKTPKLYLHHFASLEPLVPSVISHTTIIMQYKQAR